MPGRLFAALVAALLVLGVVFSSPGRARAGAGPDPALADRASLERTLADRALADLAAKLAGDDADVGRFAAQRLLEAIANRDPAVEASRAAHLTFLLQKLAQPDARAPPADLVSAERIVLAIGAWISASGLPFPTIGDVLMPLLGLGPQEFRNATRRALTALARYEKEAAREAARGSRIASAPKTLPALAARMLERGPRSGDATRDAARILWAVDGKVCLEALVEALVRHDRERDAAGKEARDAARVCLEELRSRIPLNFATSDGWVRWWGDSKDLPLEDIFAESIRRSHKMYAAQWKLLLRRMRETGDLERVLIAIQDSLEGLANAELRLAAASALGDYAQWLRDSEVKAVLESSPPVAGENPKDRLFERAVRLLITVLERKSFPLESPEVLQAALASLRQYQVFLERSPEKLGEVSALVAASLIDLSPEDIAGSRQGFLLEVLKLAGALRVRGALAFVEGLLRHPSASSGADMEVLTTAVTTLGRLIDKSVGRDTVALVIQHFKQPRNASEEAQREFRRACVNALKGGAVSPSVRADLRTFYKDLLDASGEKELRIPAILGLGALAQLNDTDSLQALGQVLGSERRFESQETMAAIDAVAYLGADAALPRFLPLLSGADKVVADHLWKKTLGLLEAGGLPALVGALRQLDALAFEDDLQAAESAARLCSTPPIDEFLSGESSDLGTDGELEEFWEVTLRLARAHDLLGEDEPRDKLLAKLAEISLKDPRVREATPDGVAELAAFRAALGSRVVLAARINALAFSDPADLVKSFEALLAEETVPAGKRGNLRWLYRTLAAAPPSDRLQRTVGLWVSTLASPQAASLLAGVPAKFRERHMSRLKALEERLKPGTAAPPVRGASE